MPSINGITMDITTSVMRHMGQSSVDPRILHPPVDTGNTSPTESNSILIAVLVPILTICILSLLAITARRIWSYNHTQRKRQVSVVNGDSEGVVEQEQPLKGKSKFSQNKWTMRTAENSNGKSLVMDNWTMESIENGLNDSEGNFPSVGFAGINKKDEETGEALANGHVCQGTDDLDYAAAAAAFQAATVPSLKRLPYTPDPDCALVVVPLQTVQVESNENIDGEADDKVAPLAQPSRMKTKPRGLLERRGSNVALTISLRAGDEHQSSATQTPTKSPKPLVYLQRASCPMSAEELHVKSYDAVRLQQEFWEIPMNHPSEKYLKVAGHGTKNRYRSILPNEHSRVKLPLSPGEDPLSSYINANYIRDCTDMSTPVLSSQDEASVIPVTRYEAAFIATQGPMPNTIGDFWRMVWEEASSSVVMITKMKEEKEKCAQYLPLEIGDEGIYDGVTVVVKSMKKREHFSVRSMELSFKGETRQLRHFWYTTWMDHETPEKTRGLLELVDEVSVWNKPNHGPVVVHCSAGIGRTGCYIAVTGGCQQLMKTGKVDILRLVAHMRLDRGGMIQTWEQYQFVHQALSRYARVLAGENVYTPSTAGSLRGPPDFNTKGSLPGSLKTRIRKPQRSLSETNLRSPKELKSTAVNVDATVPVENAVPAKNEFSKPRMKRRLPKSCSLCSPLQSPIGAEQFMSPRHNSVTRSSSPMRSVFGRQYLQNKDLNVESSSLATSKFEWPENNHCRGEVLALQGSSSKVIGKLETHETKVSEFSFPSSVVPSTPAANWGQSNSPPMNVSTSSKFLFELPGLTAETIKLPTQEDPEKIVSSKNANNKSVAEKPSITGAEDQPCFPFPSVEAR